MKICTKRLALSIATLCITATSLHAAEWTGFLGNNRDGHSSDTGLLKQWPEGGPGLLWQVDDIGPGWSSMAVVDGRIQWSLMDECICGTTQTSTASISRSGNVTYLK